MARERGTRAGRGAEWLKRPVAATGRHDAVAELLRELRLSTVCRSARCPNRGECYSAGTATFLVLGEACTRDCRFCAVSPGAPEPADATEPGRVAEAARRLGLGHVVITMVTRDDLPDGGADHVAAVVREVRAVLPDATVEVLVSDLGGDLAAVRVVASAGPDVFNHNVETVPRLYATVRPRADYARSLRMLETARDAAPGTPTKSGLMLGLGERPEEVLGVMRDLRKAGVTILTLGQYLRPSARHLPVARFVPPGEFAAHAEAARELGFAAVASAPYVRSSYRAERLLAD